MLKDLFIKLFGEEQGTEMFDKLKGHKEGLHLMIQQHSVHFDTKVRSFRTQKIQLG